MKEAQGAKHLNPLGYGGETSDSTYSQVEWNPPNGPTMTQSIVLEHARSPCPLRTVNMRRPPSYGADRSRALRMERPSNQVRFQRGASDCAKDGDNRGSSQLLGGGGREQKGGESPKAWERHRTCFMCSRFLQIQVWLAKGKRKELCVEVGTGL